MGNNTSRDIKKYLTKILSSNKPLNLIDEEVKNPNLAALLRRRILEERYGISLSATGSSILDFTELEGVQSYKPIGAIQIPVTVFDPLYIDGVHVKAEKYIPLASIYPQLMKTVELGVKLIGESRIRIKYNYCWLRLFTLNTKTDKIACEQLDEILGEYRDTLRILCFGGSGGRIINTIIIGERPPCKNIVKIIDELIHVIKTEFLGEEIPVLAPYLTIEESISVDIKKDKIDDIGVKPNVFIETYNSLEDIRSIDNSIQPILLGSIVSFYHAIGVKPEYGLRSEMKNFILHTKFRKIIVNAYPRIVLPLEILYAKTSQMNRELLGLLGLTSERIDPLAIGEIASTVGITSYIGTIASISQRLSLK